MNTAIATYQVSRFGKFWVVKAGDRVTTCRNTAQLMTVLNGGELAPDLIASQPQMPESVEAYLARGGKITKVEFPKEIPLPPPVPEKTRVAPSRITLESLGLVRKKEAG